jgi:RNA polymerase sigma-70 factor, ECF subfamily
MAWQLVGGDRAAAEDVAQEAFMRAYSGLDRFRDEARLSTWFFKILVRQAHNHRRRQRLRRWWTPVQPADAPTDEPSSDPALRKRIASAIERLSRGQREAFVLVHLQGFTVAETAGVLGKAPGTIKSHLHRALRTLRTELSDLDEEQR